MARNNITKSRDKDNYKKKGSSKNYRKKSANDKDFESAKLDNRNRDNDPNDYFVSADLARQAAQLSFQNVLGIGSVNGENIPTIAVIAMNPSPGINYQYDRVNSEWHQSDEDYPGEPDSSKVNGINLMSAKTYTLLSTFSGRTQTYDPTDVGVMELAISSVSELSEFIRRAFGVALTYNARNRAMPRLLIESMNIDFDDFQSHISDYRMRFNTAMTRINQIPLLDNVGFIRKARGLYQHIYTDSPSDMSQLYVTVPYSVWELDEDSYEKGSALVTVPIYMAKGRLIDSTSNYNPDTGLYYMWYYLNILDRLISKLLTSSTLNIVYADILNLANKLKVDTWKFDYLAENYVVMPEYNRTALLQIQHLTTLGQPIGCPYDDFQSATYAPQKDTNCDWQTVTVSRTGHPDYNIKVTFGNDVAADVETSTVIYNPLFNNLWNAAGNADAAYRDTIVNMDTNSPSPEDIIESLRYSVLWSGWKLPFKRTGSSTYNDSGDAFMSICDHYAVLIDIYSNSVPVEDHEAGEDLRVEYYAGGVYNIASNCVQKLSMLTKFSHFPYIYFKDAVFGDLDFYTTVDYLYLARVNRLMFEGLFDFRV